MKIVIWFILIILIRFNSAFSQQNAVSWENIQKSRSGNITAYWFTNDPFGYRESDGKLKGVEVEILEGFQTYLLEQYSIDLSIDWVQKNTFNEVMNEVKKDTASGIFGVAGFSITEERRSFMKFSPSYMADMAVLVSTEDIPIVRSKEDIKKYFNETIAITPQGSILEKELIELRKANDIDFQIEYIQGGHEFFKSLSNSERKFGYVSLLIYLMNLDNGLETLHRQNYLTKRYDGHGFGLSKSSDWDVPLNEYFDDPSVKKNIELIIGEYVNIDFFHFIDKLNPDNEVSLLNMEKGLHQMHLKLKELEIRDRIQKQFYLIAIVLIATVFIIVIAILFQRLRKNNKLLKDQKTEIESQSDEIMSINDNLEQIIVERLKEIESKNKALDNYAFITAHKLRAPLASILGLVDLMLKKPSTNENEIILGHLTEASKKLDAIIHEMIHVIDNSYLQDQDPAD